MHVLLLRGTTLEKLFSDCLSKLIRYFQCLCHYDWELSHCLVECVSICHRPSMMAVCVYYLFDYMLYLSIQNTEYFLSLRICSLVFCV